MARDPSTTAHSYDILIPVVAPYTGASIHKYFLRRCRYTAVARV